MAECRLILSGAGMGGVGKVLEGMPAARVPVGVFSFTTFPVARVTVLRNFRH
jgi:hypothetical protein